MTILMNLKNLNKIFIVSMIVIFIFISLKFFNPVDYFKTSDDFNANEINPVNKFIEGCIYL